MIDRRLITCGLLSVGAHFALARGLEQLPPVPGYVAPRTIEIRIVMPTPPEPLPEPPPEPIVPPPEPVVAPPIVPSPVRPPPHPRPATTTPIVPAPVTTTNDSPATTARTDADPTAHPVFGVTLESTSTAGRGPALPVGNTTRADPGTARPGAAVTPLAPPAPAYQVTRMPLPQGRCSGAYTAEARAAGIEGVVVLDLIVDERGHPRDIDVVTGLSHGLTEAAIAAVRACTFSPGERGGQAVPVRVRGFKIRFRLQDPT